MIRINLLGVERQKTRSAPTLLDTGQRTIFACSLIVGLTVLGISGWYWSLTREASRLETEIASAEKEMARLKTVLAEVARAEERRAQLKQRVAIIEELRQGQGVPVQLLDHVSRSLPDLLWLTALDQKDGVVNIEGRTTTLISLADFVGNLGTNKLVTKPIDIVNSQVEPTTGDTKAGTELIKFAVKAPLTQKPSAAARAGGPGAAAATPVQAAR